MSYQKCPVCNGVGIVSGGYFNRAGDYNHWEASDTIDCCRVCHGTGLIDEITGMKASDTVMSDEHKAGIKEVVEWIIKNSETFETHSGRIIEFNLRKTDWQSKLKEWGLALEP